MARGYPDYNNPEYSLAARNIDIASMLLVQSGIGPVDGRGRIVWFENFREGVLSWNKATVGAGLDPVVTLEVADHSPVSCLLDTGGAAGGDSVQMYKATNFPGSTRMGLQVSYMALDSYGALEFYILRSTVPIEYEAHVRIDFSTGVIQVLKTGAVLQTVATFTVTPTQETFYTLKVVADFTTGYLVRMMFGDTEIDLSTIKMVDYGTGVIEQVQIVAEAFTDAAHRTVAYLGHLIVTTRTIKRRAMRHALFSLQ
jgi:hypothetical protein